MSGNEGSTPTPAATSAAPARSRYQVEERDGERWIVCGSARNIRLHVVHGLSVGEAARKRYPEQTIFLDGVYTGPPFYDNKARHYSLDHHTGCVRAFTLATCEQAAVMVLQGLPLGEGEWHLYVNLPDLDALLAGWVLLNHLELLADNAELFWRTMPLIRVEGVIDAHGLDMEILCGMDRQSYLARKEALDRLRAEQRLTAVGRWESIDLVSYSRRMLDAFDAEIFPPELLARLLDIDEIATISLQGQKLAVLCRSHLSIYEVEALLKERHEKQLALIVLDLGGGRYTLRQADPFLDKNLTALYPALNQRDSRASDHGGADNLWGGSDDIGGSPRATGSALSGEEILKIAQQVYGGSGWLDRLVRRFRP